MKDQIQEFIYLDAITKTMEEDRKFNKNMHNQINVMQHQITNLEKKNKRLKLSLILVVILNMIMIGLITILIVK